MTKKVWLQLALLAFFVLLGSVACSWMLSDITGEYGANGGNNSVIHMSIIRKATTVKSMLNYGNGALLEVSAPFANTGDQLDWTYSVPQKWIDRGQKQHSVHFHGRVEDGFVEGVLEDGKKVIPIKLPRDPIASVYRTLQSHLPWVS